MWNLYIVLQSRIKDCTLHYQSIISNWCVKIILYEENYDMCYHPNDHLWTLPSIVYYSIIDRLYALRNQHYVNQCICTLMNILKLDIYHWKRRYFYVKVSSKHLLWFCYMNSINFLDWNRYFMDLLAQFQWSTCQWWCTTSCFHQHLHIFNSFNSSDFYH